jgi:hypothetical protein
LLLLLVDDVAVVVVVDVELDVDDGAPEGVDVAVAAIDVMI